MVSKVFEHPFDLCKVRLQAQVLDEVHRFNGPVDCLTQTWKSEGIRGLYRVSGISVCRACHTFQERSKFSRQGSTIPHRRGHT